MSGPNPMALSRNWRDGTQIGIITREQTVKVPASSLDSKEGHGRPFYLLCVYHIAEWLHSAPLEQDRFGNNSHSWTINGARNTNIFLEPSSFSLSPHLYLTPALFLGSQTALSRIPSACSQPEKVNSRRKRSRPEHSPQGTGSYNVWGWRASSAVRSTCWVY